MSDDAKNRPFHCGTQYADWQINNCERCRKGDDFRNGTPWQEGRAPSCDLETALGVSYITNGTVTNEVYDRLFGPIKVDRHLYGQWVCGEFEPMTWDVAKAAAKWFETRKLEVPKAIREFAPHMEAK